MVVKEKGGKLVIGTLVFGIVLMAAAVICHQIAEANGWQFCNWVIVTVQALLNVYIAALITCLVWLLEYLSQLPVKASVSLGKVFWIAMAVMALSWMVPSPIGFNFLTYGFGHQEEWQVEIDGTAYIARLESKRSLEPDAISYHKQINAFLYEKAGWAEDGLKNWPR